MLVERGERFIEDPQRRRREIQPCQADATLLTGGQGVTGHVFEAPQSYLGKGLPDRVAARGLMQSAEPGEIFFRSQQPLIPAA